jgi:hypothetical protein
MCNPLFCFSLYNREQCKYTINGVVETTLCNVKKQTDEYLYQIILLHVSKNISTLTKLKCNLPIMSAN